MNLSKKQNAPYIYSVNNKIINDYLLKNPYRCGKIIMSIYIVEIRAFFRANGAQSAFWEGV